METDFTAWHIADLKEDVALMTERNTDLFQALTHLVAAIESADNPRDMGLDRDDDAVIRAKAVLNGRPGQ